MVVEAALITSLLLVFLFAVIDFGFALHVRLSVGNMSTAGARSGSGQGNEPLADLYVLRAVSQGSGGVSRSEIRSIVVYKALGPNSTVPAACLSASVSGTCNRYVGTDLARDSSQFGCKGPPGPTTKIDNPWCPTGRKTALTGTYGPPDYLGVYVEVAHDRLTGLFGSKSTISSNTIIRVEPRTEA